MANPSVTIVVPVYNERRSIEKTVLSINDALKGREFELICVDDGSEDGSGGILDKLAEKSLTRVIHHRTNKGYGASLKTGIRESKSDWIMITDSDGTYPIRMMGTLLDRRPGHDMVVGARIGRKVSIPLLRRPVKHILNRFSSYLAGQRIPDLNSGLRVFKKEIVMRYWNLFPQRFSFTSTLTMICATKGYETLFIPINYNKREGKSGIHPLKDTLRFFTLLFRLSLYFNPMRTFIPLSVLVLIIAVLRGVRDLMVTADQHLGNLAVGLFVLSIQIFFFGLIADIISKK